MSFLELSDTALLHSIQKATWLLLLRITRRLHQHCVSRKQAAGYHANLSFFSSAHTCEQTTPFLSQQHHRLNILMLCCISFSHIRDKCSSGRCSNWELHDLRQLISAPDLCFFAETRSWTGMISHLTALIWLCRFGHSGSSVIGTDALFPNTIPVHLCEFI